MKSFFFLCVVLALVACYSSSPVAKESNILQGIKNFVVETQGRSKRSVELLPEFAKAAVDLSKEVSSTRKKRSNGAMLNALAQFQESAIASDRVAKVLKSDFVDALVEHPEKK